MAAFELFCSLASSVPPSVSAMSRQIPAAARRRCARSKKSRSLHPRAGGRDHGRNRQAAAVAGERHRVVLMMYCDCSGSRLLLIRITEHFINILQWRNGCQFSALPWHSLRPLLRNDIDRCQILPLALEHPSHRHHRPVSMGAAWPSTAQSRSVIDSLLLKVAESAPSGARPTQGVRNRPVAEVDHRPAKDAACGIGAQPRAPVAVEESQTKFTRVLIYSAFAGTCDLPFAHQGRHA